jgi:topoisomerase-4 subunit B
MNIDHVLDYYMGKNTPERQDFIIENLRVELDVIDTPEEEAQIMPEVVEEEV